MSTVDAVLARVPAWQAAAELQTSFLSGGITNKNYRVDADGVSSVLRLTGANTDQLGIDRRHELAAARAAAAIGLAPEVLYFIEPEGYLVTRFVEGRPISLAEMQSQPTLTEVAGLLLRLHAMAPIPGLFSPFRVVERYHQIAAQLGVTALPMNFASLLAHMRSIEIACRQPPFVLCPCHNDLLNENFLREDSTGLIRILDWEYAGMGDPQFDLANLAGQHDFADEHDQALLQAYFGGVTPRQLARHKLLRLMSDFREAMWGVAQLGLSTLDFDFDGYAHKYFQRLTAGLADPRFPGWLADLAVPA